MLTDAEAAWLACAIDSEGTITLQVYQQKGKSSPRVVAYVNVVNTDIRYVDHAEALISQIVDGCHRGVRKRGQGTVCEVLFVSVSSQPRVGALLEAVLPYLIVKKVRAEALLAYFDERDAARSERNGTAPYGPELDRLYERFYSDDIRVNPRRRIGHGH